ncbi:MAG: hypothetical protein HUU10_08520 [Bacteroidetes bacterium]|nr:hypothetical protein [Bacteroidota bacterium]
MKSVPHFFLLFFPLLLSAQELVFHNYSVSDGLSQNSVTAIRQSANGLMWVATRDGLNLFNGYGFTPIRKHHSGAVDLADNQIQALLEDHGGRLWVGYHGQGLDEVDWKAGRTRLWSAEGSGLRVLPGRQVRVLKETGDQVLVGFDDAGLAVIHPGRGEVTKWPDSLNGVVYRRVREVIHTSDGSYWVGTFGSGLIHVSANGVPLRQFRQSGHPDSLASDRIQSLLPLPGDQLLVGTYQAGLQRFNPETGLFERIRFRGMPAGGKDLSVWAMLTDTRGSVWVGTYGNGLWRYLPEQNELIPIRLLTGRGSVTDQMIILSLSEDRSGNLWVGTETGGLFKADLKPVKFNLGGKEGPVSSIMSFARVSPDDLWVGTYGGGISVYDGRHQLKKIISRISEPRLPNGFILSLLADSSGVWAGSSSGLIRFATSGQVDTVVLRLSGSQTGPADDIRVLNRTASGDIWAGTIGNGLWIRRMGSDRFVRPENLPAGLQTASIRAILPDTNQWVWVGTLRGLYHYQVSSGVTHLYTREPDDTTSLSDSYIRSLSRDVTNTLWVGTTAGLNRFHPETRSFTRITEKDGLPNGYIYGILPDRAGFLWMPTNSGLVRYHPETGSMRSFDESDGLQSKEFNGGSWFRDASERFYVGGIEGFNWFIPGEVTDNQFAPPLVLTDFSIMNQPVAGALSAPFLTSIRLKFRQNLFSLEFASLDYTNPDKNRYRFMLEGFDEEWSALTSRRYITYTNLDPGDYQLLVQGTNSDGRLSTDTLSIAIRVVPPFYRTWWFSLLVLAGLGAGLYALGRYREFRREQQERERVELLRQITIGVLHELRQPLQIVSGNLEIIDMVKDEGPGEVGVPLARAGEGIGRMKKLMAKLEQLLNDAKFKTKKYTKDQTMIDLTGENEP